MSESDKPNVNRAKSMPRTNRSQSGDLAGGSAHRSAASGTRSMNAPTPVRTRSRPKRSQSFKRTGTGKSTAKAVPADDNTDLLAELQGMETKPEPRTPPRTASSASTASSANVATSGFGTKTSTAFVKNFLDDEDDKAGGNSTLQGFDADHQRNVHRSLLSPSPDSPDNSPERTNLHSRGARSTRGDPQSNLFQQRDGFNYVDQSVNLMDAETGKYESKNSNKNNNVYAHGQASMVEIFLKDSAANATASVNNATSKAHRWWHHPQRRSEWNLMSTWDKTKEIASRLLLPLFCFAMIGVTILVIMLVYQGSGDNYTPKPAPTTAAPVPEVVAAPQDAKPIVNADGMTATMQAISQELIQLKILDADALKDKTSPAFQALDWVSTDDLALNGTPDKGRRRRRRLQAESQERLVQRYVLAVLHYSWNGKTNNGPALSNSAIENMGLLGGGTSSGVASNNALWLTAQSECHWKGVKCHDEPKRTMITTTLHEATQVRALNLTQHGLEGALPTELTALTHLVELDLRHNQLSGNLHSLKWSNWKKMEYLLLGNNALTGNIPEDISEMERIIDVDLGDNKLTGTIPALTDGQLKLQDMENIFLDNNELTGTIPASFLRDMPHLGYLDLSNNKLTGPIPEMISELTELRYFHADENELTGNLPESMSGMDRLDAIALDNNKLSGPLPTGIFSGMSRLRFLQLNGNDFSGPLPSSVADMEKLKTLDLSQNAFTGSIPDSWSSGMPVLEEALLFDNKLTGLVPASLCETPDGLADVVVDCSSGDITCECCTRCE